MPVSAVPTTSAGKFSIQQSPDNVHSRGRGETNRYHLNLEEIDELVAVALRAMENDHSLESIASRSDASRETYRKLNRHLGWP